MTSAFSHTLAKVSVSILLSGIFLLILVGTALLFWPEVFLFGAGAAALLAGALGLIGLIWFLIRSRR